MGSPRSCARAVSVVGYCKDIKNPENTIPIVCVSVDTQGCTMKAPTKHAKKVHATPSTRQSNTPRLTLQDQHPTKADLAHKYARRQAEQVALLARHNDTVHRQGEHRAQIRALHELAMSEEKDANEKASLMRQVDSHFAMYMALEPQRVALRKEIRAVRRSIVSLMNMYHRDSWAEESG